MAASATPVASYRMHATLDVVAHKVHGEGTVTWRNSSTKPVRELWMHLYLNAFKNQASVFMRQPIGGFRGGEVPERWGSIDLRTLRLVSSQNDSIREDLLPQLERSRPGDSDETDARIPLPREIAPGESVKLEMIWDDELPSIVERTGFDGSFHMVAQWFPKLAKLEADGSFAHFPFHHLGEFYADYGTYDVTIDVPETFQIGATGPVVEQRLEAGRRIERHVQENVHDFAFAAWDKFRTRRERIGEVDVTVLYPRGGESTAERELETLRFALPHYGARYGRYPYPVLTVVHPPASASEAGGMEYPTLITTGGSLNSPRGMRFVEIVTMHEFGHQYFYGLLASNEDAWPFLDEGLNQYAETEAMRAMKGPGSAIELPGISVGDIEAQAERGRHFVHDEPVAQGAGSFQTGSSYAALVYSRTATLLETLARTYGKAKLERALGVYARRFRFAHPRPEDLLATVRQELGPNAAEVLRVGLFEKGWVDYEVSQISSHAAHPALGLFDRNGARETVTRSENAKATDYAGTVLVTRKGTLRLPVSIALLFEDGSTKRVDWSGEESAYRIPFSSKSPLVRAIVDPDDAVLLDDNPANNVALAYGSSPRAPRVLTSAAFWASVILGAFGP